MNKIEKLLVTSVALILVISVFSLVLCVNLYTENEKIKKELHENDLKWVEQQKINIDNSKLWESQLEIDQDILDILELLSNYL